MQVRINKYIGESGYCSRREADKYIEQGAVTIDGKKAGMGSQVSPGQVVKILGDVINGKATPIIIAYNKPMGVVSTTDPAERDNVVNAIAHTDRIFPIGRLDKDSQGLLLLTNDGDIVNKILRVNNNHDKEYFVIVDKPITPDFIKRMQGGLPILGVVTRRCEITQKTPTSFTIVLRQGLNRQIRRMCELLGYNVTKLQRTRVMHILLGDLKMGQYRNLTEEESEIMYKKIATSVKTEEASTRKKKSTSGSRQPSKSSQSARPEVKMGTPRNPLSKRKSLDRSVPTDNFKSGKPSYRSSNEAKPSRMPLSSDAARPAKKSTTSAKPVVHKAMTSDEAKPARKSSLYMATKPSRKPSAASKLARETSKPTPKPARKAAPSKKARDKRRAR